MKRALILYGPSASGKTTIAHMIVDRHGFKHVDTDVFRQIYSNQRSEERTAVAGEVALCYAQELVKREHDIIIEALPDKYLDALKKTLQAANYAIFEASLKTTLEKSLENNNRREKKRQMSEQAIKESHEWYAYERGLVIDRLKTTVEEAYEKIEKEFLA